MTKGEGKFTQRVSTLSLTSALDAVGVEATPRLVYSCERPGTHSIGGWVVLGAGLDRCGESLPHWDSNPGPSSP
jgi:hypothetical protein